MRTQLKWYLIKTIKKNWKRVAFKINYSPNILWVLINTINDQPSKQQNKTWQLITFQPISNYHPEMENREEELYMSRKPPIIYL